MRTPRSVWPTELAFYILGSAMLFLATIEPALVPQIPVFGEGWVFFSFAVRNLATSAFAWWELFYRNAVEPPQDGVPVKANVAAERETWDRILRSRTPFFINPGDFDLQPFRDFFGCENLQNLLAGSCSRRAGVARIRGAGLAVHPRVEVVNVDEPGIGDGRDPEFAATDEFFDEPRGRGNIRGGVIHRKQPRRNRAGDGESISHWA
jgi:hypothetical protein